MHKGKRILAVVPARGGSKGVPHKNIHLLAGKPLIAYTGDIVRSLGFIDRAVVSTDDLKIADAARKAGLEAPFMRPASLSGDLISDYAVLRHALEEMEKQDGRPFDIVLMLQPTSPLRQTSHVAKTVNTLIDGGWDSVWTVSPTDLKYHPQKQLKISSDGAMDYYDPQGSAIIARQQLSPVYHRNGAAYALTRDCLLTQESIKGKRSAAVVIDDPLVSIDTLADFAKVEEQIALITANNP